MQRNEASIPNLEALPLGHALVTRDAAAVLGRSPQTLRKWACLSGVNYLERSATTILSGAVGR